MNIAYLVENLGANIVFLPQNINTISFYEIIAGDLMADLLVTQKQDCLLITGLATEQSIRTADMLGCVGVLLVNEKLPTLEMKKLAEETNMPLLATALPLYETCVEVNKLMQLSQER